MILPISCSILITTVHFSGKPSRINTLSLIGLIHPTIIIGYLSNKSLKYFIIKLLFITVPSATTKPENQEPAEPPEPTPSNPTVETAPNTSEAISSTTATETEISPATAEVTPVVSKTETVADGVAETVEGVSETVSARMSAVASANAAALLCDIILTGCAVENSQPR